MAAIRFICTLLLGVSLIGMSQAAEGDIRLSGSDRRIQGKLEIEHSGRWRSVCFDDWTHEDASTACRQLGYSKGAMIFKADNGAFGGSSTPTLRAPGCTSSSNRLVDCPNFQFQESLSCSRVIISCYVDDFRGCYRNLPIAFQAQLLQQTGTQYSIESCITFCRGIPLNPRFAALAGSRCYCEPDDRNLGSTISVSDCSEECTADDLESCGMNTGVTEGNFAVWPVTVGASTSSLTTTDGCLYSRDFPGRYKTTSAPSTDTYTVTLPSTAYVSLKVKMLDVSDGDRLEFRDTTSGSAMATVNLAEPSIQGTAVIPIQTRISTFSVSFHITDNSPNLENYGFIVCYESLGAIPPDPTTRPAPDPTTKAPTDPPTDPPTEPPIEPPTVPTTAPPEVPTNPPVVQTTMAAMPTTPTEEVVTTKPPIVTTMTEPSTTVKNQPTEVCPAYQGNAVESRQGRGPNDMLLINTGNPFNCTGFITAVSFYSAENQMFMVSVWHPEHSTIGYKYALSARTQIQGAIPGTASVSIPEEEWLSFGPGDVMGVRVQTSPLVFSDMAAAPWDATPWMSWGLDDGSQPGTVLDVRDSNNATGLNYTYSLFASIKAKDRCLIPVVPKAEYTDALIAYVYERETYTLECRDGYESDDGKLYTCQAGGDFDRPLKCERNGVFFGLTFAQIIILMLVLVLLCLTVFISCCAMLCCGSAAGGGRHAASRADKAEAAPAKSFDEADAALNDGDSMDDNRFLINIEDEDSEGVINTAADEPPIYDNRDPTVAAAEAAAADAAVADAAAETEGTAVMDNPVHNMADDSSQ